MRTINRDSLIVTSIMVAVAIVANIATGQLIYGLEIPLYLDSVGTVMMGILAGPMVGALTGLLSNLLWGFSGLNVTIAPYAGVAAIIGMLAGLFAELGLLRQWWKVALAGLITGFLAAVMSAPITAYVWGGVTGSGTDAVTAIFRAIGAGVLPASFAQGVSSDPLDKAITFLLAWLIIKILPGKFLARFPRAKNLSESQE